MQLYSADSADSKCLVSDSHYFSLYYYFTIFAAIILPWGTSPVFTEKDSKESYRLHLRKKRVRPSKRYMAKKK